MFGWKSLFRKDALDAQLDSELRFHIEKLTSDYIAGGMTPEEARRQAVLEFGGREQIKEELRDVYRVRVIESTLANLKSAFRIIRKSPTFSGTVILKPLPFPDANQLMRVDQYNPKTRSPLHLVAPVRLEDWNSLNSTFQALTGYYAEDVSESTGPLP